MDLKKIFDASKIPIIYLVILDLVCLTLSFAFPEIFNNAAYALTMPLPYMFAVYYGLMVMGLVIGEASFSGFPWLGLFSFVFGLIVLLAALLIYLWAGYQSVKKFKLGIGGAALSGLITAFIVSLINSIMWVALEIFGLRRFAIGGRGGPYSAGESLEMLMGYLVIHAIFWMVVGVVMGALGGLLPQKQTQSKRNV